MMNGPIVDFARPYGGFDAVAIQGRNTFARIYRRIRDAPGLATEVIR